MPQTFGQLLRQIMARERVRQKALGREIGRDQGNILRLLNLPNPELIGLEQLAKICRLFPADARALLNALTPSVRDDIVRLLGGIPSSHSIGWTPMTDEDHRLARVIAQIQHLPPEQRGNIITMMELYCERFQGNPSPSRGNQKDTVRAAHKRTHP